MTLWIKQIIRLLAYSVLPIVAKIFERIIQKQINDFIISFLSIYLCGYRRGFNNQHTFLTIVENRRKSLDNKSFGDSILMNLSKVFDTLNHELLIAKLHACRFQHDTLKLLHSYPSKRWHRTKVNTPFSLEEEIEGEFLLEGELIKGLSQGSVLGPIVINLYLNDLFYLANCMEVCNFVDDTMFHSCDNGLNTLIKSLEHDVF